MWRRQTSSGAETSEFPGRCVTQALGPKLREQGELLPLKMSRHARIRFFAPLAHDTQSCSSSRPAGVGGRVVCVASICWSNPNCQASRRSIQTSGVSPVASGEFLTSSIGFSEGSLPRAAALAPWRESSAFSRRPGGLVGLLDFMVVLRIWPWPSSTSHRQSITPAFCRSFLGSRATSWFLSMSVTEGSRMWLLLPARGGPQLADGAMYLSLSHPPAPHRLPAHTVRRHVGDE